MKKLLLSLLLVMVMSLGLLAGCSNQENPQIALAVVVGKHGNSMEIPLNAPSIKEAIYNSCYTYGSVAFVSVDGNPKVYYQANIPRQGKGKISLIRDKIFVKPHDVNHNGAKQASQNNYHIQNSHQTVRKFQNNVSRQKQIQFVKKRNTK